MTPRTSRSPSDLISTSVRTDPYIVGEEIRLRSHGRGEKVYVVAPSGIELGIPVPHGSYPLTLSEPGEWTVRWEKGDTEKFQVVRADPSPPAEEQESEPVKKPSASLSTLST